MRLINMVVLLLVAMTLPAAEIYRRADRGQGIEFSDKPDPAAERVILRDPVVVPIPGYPTPAPTEQPARPAVKMKPGAAYTQLQILTPADDATVRANDGVVPVQVLLIPPLQTALGHKLLLRMDDATVSGPGESTNFNLTDVPRGTHQLQAQVLATDGSEVMASTVSRFHLHRQTVEQARPPKGAQP